MFVRGDRIGYFRYPVIVREVMPFVSSYICPAYTGGNNHAEDWLPFVFPHYRGRVKRQARIFWRTITQRQYPRVYRLYRNYYYLAYNNITLQIGG